MEEQKELYQKMAAVMGKVGYIKKRGRNQAQGYDYVMAADIAGEMGKLLAEHGLAFAPVLQTLDWETRESARGNAMFVCRLHVIYSLMDTETGQSIQIPSFGEGMDTGDKAAYKAMTGALKYALIQTFLIAAGDDPEEETEEKEVKSPLAQTTAGVRSGLSEKVADKPLRVMQQSDRKWCPDCGQQTIIKGRPEFGGGFVCYKKFGGCGAKFSDNDDRVLRGSASGLLAERFDQSQAKKEITGGVTGEHSEGDNGERASAGGLPAERERISGENLAELRAWCVTFNVQEAAVLKQYQMRDPSVKSLADLTPEMFAHAAQVFATKKEKANKLN